LVMRFAVLLALVATIFRFSGMTERLRFYHTGPSDCNRLAEPCLP
jgi:hypothetical protein